MEKFPFCYYYRVGREASVVFQKNLDHYYSYNPVSTAKQPNAFFYCYFKDYLVNHFLSLFFILKGYFEIRVGDSDDSFYKTLATVRDSDEIKSLDTQTVSFVVPE